MKSFISMVLSITVVFGGMYYFFRDTHFFNAVISHFSSAKTGESLRHVYARRVSHAIRDSEPTDYGMLRDYFTESATLKFAAMAGEDELIKREEYLNEKFEQFKYSALAVYDKDNSGEIERSEWFEDDIFKFSVLDGNGDSVLTIMEYWASVEESSYRAFKRADADGNGMLDRDEYIAQWGGMEAASEEYAKLLDRNNNGAVSSEEVRLMIYNTDRDWRP